MPDRASILSPIAGNLDLVRPERIAGWAFDPVQPDVPVEVDISVDGQLLVRLRANAYRADLRRPDIGAGHGRHAFEFRPYPPLSSQRRQIIAVRCTADGCHVPGSPQVLEANIATAAPVIAVETEPAPKVAPQTDRKTTGGLQGNLDLVRRDLITGWAHDPARPGTAQSLLVTVNGELLERVLANRYRADLEQAGYGDGRRSFELTPVPVLSPLLPQTIEVCRENDGGHLPGSPRVLAPEAEFSADAQAWMTRLFADADSEAGLDERVDFLTRQLEQLLQRRADRHAHRFERQLRRQSSLRWVGAKGQDVNEAARDRAPGQLRVLVIDERAPAAGRDAGSNAILSHMQSLQRLGFEVSFASAEMIPDIGDSMKAEGIDCCRPPWYASVEEVLQRQAHCFDLVYLHRLAMADRYTALARQHQPKARLVYSIADLHYLRLDRQARVEQRPELVSAAKRTQVAELLAISRVDQVITHSRYEADLLRRQVPQARVHVIPWAIPLRPTRLNFAQRRGIAFIGGYGHPPNVDAAHWLITDILPRLRAHDPAFECLLVGSDMPASLKKPRPGVVPVGQVDSLAEIFDRVRLTVAPLTYGAGIKGKVLESLAAAVPCVCTPVAAEGLDLPEPLLRHVSDDAVELAAAIIRLHDDAGLNAELADAGLSYISEHFSKSRIDALMRTVAGLPAFRAPS